MTTTTNVRRFDITGGPTADRLWDAAKYAYEPSGARVPVDFTTSSRLAGPPESSAWIVLKPRISGVEHEDGSGHSLLIRGWLNGNQYFKGYYHAKTRSGFIELYT